MTKRELVKALERFPDDVEVDVRSNAFTTMSDRQLIKKVWLGALTNVLHIDTDDCPDTRPL